MPKDCWDLKHCPVSHYMNCEAYKERVSCWERKNGCLCHVYPSCDDCYIFQLHLEDLKSQESD